MTDGSRTTSEHPARRMNDRLDAFTRGVVGRAAGRRRTETHTERVGLEAEACGECEAR